MQAESKPRVALLGLGIMGIGMARRLLGAGFPLTVYNRDAAKAAPLAVEGARIAATPRQAAEGAGCVIAMLADDVASRAIWLGEHGALAGAAPGAICIDASTLTVAWARELAAAAEARGLKFLDAPVTGTKPHAANGELTFLVGGDAQALDHVRPVLACMSKEIIHLGPNGSGAALKLINNFMAGVQAVALAEGLALLQRENLDPRVALPLLLNGAPGSPMVKVLAARQGNNDYTPNFQLKLLTKDLGYAVAEAQRLGLKLETASAALIRLNAAVAAGLGDQDMAIVIKHVGQAPAI